MENKEEKNIVYTGSFPFMTDIQVYNIAKETYVKTKNGPWQHYLDTLIEARDEGINEALGILTETTNKNDILFRMSESTKKALRQPKDSRYGITSYSLALAEEMRTKNYGGGNLKQGYVFKNPYLLPPEQMPSLLKKVPTPEQPAEESEDFDENGLLKHDCEFRVEARARAAEKQKRIESGLEPLPEDDIYEKRWGKNDETQEDAKS